MELISILAAAVASFMYGAVHYNVLSKPWIAASGVKIGADGKPIGPTPAYLPFVVFFIAMLLAAGMMRHIFATSGIDTVGGALVSGLGIGAFFIAPFTFLNNSFSNRPFMLSVIDGSFAIIACGIIGLVLALL